MLEGAELAESIATGPEDLDETVRKNHRLCVFLSPGLGGHEPYAGLVSEDAGRVGERICRGCGERLRRGARPRAEVCSSACRSRQWRRERRLRQRLAAARDGMGEAECSECGTRWVADVDRRSDAVFCSPR